MKFGFKLSSITQPYHQIQKDKKQKKTSDSSNLYVRRETMEEELVISQRRSTSSSSYFANSCIMSPSCFPVHDELQYSRIPHHYCTSGTNKRGRRWRNFLRRLVRDGKTSTQGTTTKDLSFHYDAVSYSQNFDEGCRYDQLSGAGFRQGFRDVRWEIRE